MRKTVVQEVPVTIWVVDYLCEDCGSHSRPDLSPPVPTPDPPESPSSSKVDKIETAIKLVAASRARKTTRRLQSSPSPTGDRRSAPRKVFPLPKSPPTNEKPRSLLEILLR